MTRTLGLAACGNSALEEPTTPQASLVDIARVLDGYSGQLRQTGIAIFGRNV